MRTLFAVCQTISPVSLSVVFLHVYHSASDINPTTVRTATTMETHKLITAVTIYTVCLCVY